MDATIYCEVTIRLWGRVTRLRFADLQEGRECVQRAGAGRMVIRYRDHADCLSYTFDGKFWNEEGLNL